MTFTIAASVALALVSSALLTAIAIWFAMTREIRARAAEIIEGELNSHLDWAAAVSSGAARGMELDEVIGTELWHREQAGKMAVVLVALGRSPEEAA